MFSEFFILYKAFLHKSYELLKFISYQYHESVEDVFESYILLNGMLRLKEVEWPIDDHSGAKDTCSVFVSYFPYFVSGMIIFSKLKNL